MAFKDVYKNYYYGRDNWNFQCCYDFFPNTTANKNGCLLMKTAALPLPDGRQGWLAPLLLYPPKANTLLYPCKLHQPREYTFSVYLVGGFISVTDLLDVLKVFI